MANSISIYFSVLIFVGLSFADQAVGQQKNSENELKSIIGIEKLDRQFYKILLRNKFVVTPEFSDSIATYYDPLDNMPDAARKQYDKEKKQVWEQDSIEQAKNVSQKIKTQAHKSILPVFITTDVMLHAYHHIYSDSIKSMEKKSANSLKKLYVYFWNDVKRENEGNLILSAKEAGRLIGLVAVGRKVLEKDWNPKGIKLPDWVDEEVKRVRKASGRYYSKAWDRQIEYSVFKPRGLYANEDVLQRYFAARMWFSRYPFRVTKDVEVRMAITLALPGSDDCDRLLAPYQTLLGHSEDPSLKDLGAIVRRYSEKDDWEESFRSDIGKIIGKLKDKYKPNIRIGDAPNELSEQGQLWGIYILPPSYILGGQVFTEITSPPILNRRLPRGLDMMAVLGSDWAMKYVLLQAEKKFGGKFASLLQKALKKAQKVSRKDTQGSELTRLYLRVIKLLLNPTITKIHPSFMHNEAYLKKSTQTALAGWAEHRSRWILHAKQVGGMFGAPDYLESPSGFVEPNVEFWNRLLDLTILTQKTLSELGNFDYRWNELMWAIVRCRTISTSQLAGKRLTKEEQKFLSSFEKTLDSLFKTRFAENPGDICVADVYREVLERKVVHVGTGPCQAIYVVYPYGGKNWLCKGGVMTYREYVSDAGKVLTNSEWIKMLPKIPQPKWTKVFTAPVSTKTSPGTKKQRSRCDGGMRNKHASASRSMAPSRVAGGSP